MMVTFVSQCEKKALTRTRRVLDAFADRIGDNTWQTVITQEGLNAVKKLLRKTASKSTAVSCFWIRSRSRSELIWIVGNKNKFNSQGVVPVNYTNNELIMDNTSPVFDTVYANTNSQPLSQHLFAVGYLAQYLLRKLVSEDNTNLVYAAYVAGCFHDVGKIDPEFQAWLHKKIQKDKEQTEQQEDGVHIDKTVKGNRFFDDHPRHNEISFLMLNFLHNAGSDLLNKKQLEYVKHTVYWHHAKPIREISFKHLSDIYKKFKGSLKNTSFSEIHSQSVSLLKLVAEIASQYSGNDLKIPMLQYKLDDDFEDDLRKELPDYKIYDESVDTLTEIKKSVRENAQMAVIRSAVVTADRIISSLTAKQLDELIKGRNLESLVANSFIEESNLKSQIQSCLNGFESKYPDSRRNTEQSRVAKELCGAENIAVLNGPAGCGKTKIALEWAVNKSAKKIIWVCPRVQVCQGIYADLTESEYLPNSSIEIYTGEFKKITYDNIEKPTESDEVFSGDIVITTIDQVINSVVTHTQVTALVDFMNAHVVFDEYHELINMPAFNLLFAELVACKKLRSSAADTLLVSATPNYHFLEGCLEIHRDDIKGIESFNTSRYKITFDIYDDGAEGELSPLIKEVQKNNTFVITNTARDAQLGFIKNIKDENAILFHSKFTRADKMDIFNKVYECFKENGEKTYDVLRSGPIVQASLNISCDKMLTEFTNAENWLQRLGRLDRFGKNVDTNEYITVLGKSIDAGKIQSSVARFLNKDNYFYSAKAWYEFLKSKDIAGKEVTVNELYALYQKFYSDEKSLQEIEKDFMGALKKSIKSINNNILDPIRVPGKKKIKSGTIKIKKQSLRGNNRFVQMAICYILKYGEYEFRNEYAYPEDIDHEANNVGLTASIEEITGYGDSDNNLLAFMKKKHHQIKDDAVKAYKDFQIVDAARSPENPVYLSYTPKDLEPIGGESQAHEFAVYYAVCDKQPIGSISINKLKLKGE